jgi:hypothetical protein
MNVYEQGDYALDDPEWEEISGLMHPECFDAFFAKCVECQFEDRVCDKPHCREAYESMCACCRLIHLVYPPSRPPFN